MLLPQRSLGSTLEDSSFVKNTANHGGGSIGLVDTGEKGLLIGGTNITNSSALNSGAVYGSPETAMIITNGSRLAGDTAITDGGAVFCNGCQFFALTDSTELWDNEALGSGGECYFYLCWTAVNCAMPSSLACTCMLRAAGHIAPWVLGVRHDTSVLHWLAS